MSYRNCWQIFDILYHCGVECELECVQFLLWQRISSLINFMIAILLLLLLRGACLCDPGCITCDINRVLIAFLALVV